MKVAILSESSADEAAIRILVEGILGRKTQEGLVGSLRTREGWPSVIKILPVVITQLYYHSDTEAIVIIVDSDDSPLHEQSHIEAGATNEECRLCRIRNVIASQERKLKPMAGRANLKFAVGIATPAIEAWYLCGIDPHVNEAAWGRKLQGETCTYTRRTLKRNVYGTERPPIDTETYHAVQAASRLVDCIPLVQQLFPKGFGAFVNDLQKW